MTTREIDGAGPGAGPGVGPPRSGGHPGELALRRLQAGESLGAEHEATAAHSQACPECQRRLADVAAEQRAFEAHISFDRFAAGVERAARRPSIPEVSPAVGSGASVGVASLRRWWRRPASERSFLVAMSAGALAAGLALYVGVRPLFREGHLGAASRADGAEGARNRLKGGEAGAVVMRIAGRDGGQRFASANASEALSPGERVRIGVRAGERRFLFAVAIDDRGEVTPLYPDDGSSSLLLPADRSLQYLPDSFELTGAGRERVVVLLTDTPVDLELVRRAVGAAFTDAGGDVTRLPALAVPGDQVHQLFSKAGARDPAGPADRRMR